MTRGPSRDSETEEEDNDDGEDLSNDVEDAMDIDNLTQDTGH